MASTYTGVTSSTGPSTGSNAKRTLPPGGDPSPSPKRRKKQSRLDKLKADLQAQVEDLKTQLITFQKFLLDEQVAKKNAEGLYVTLLSTCDYLLKPKDPTISHLALFQVPFADNFESEETLRGHMDQGRIAAHNSMLHIITSLLTEITQLIEAALTEIEGPPEPSAYAHHATWRIWQKRHTAILNLRPETNQGLPIETLHPAFAAFLDDVRLMRPEEWAPEEEANTASIDLCKAMANTFEDENARRTKLKELLGGLGLQLQTEFYIQPTPLVETHAARADLHLSGRTGKTILLGEIKVEFESGDPYMQVSRSYQTLVNYLKSQKQASDGVPCILLAICGPLFMVAAGFSDGEHIIVEPLAQPCMMLPSRYNHRERLLSRILFFTRKAIHALQRPSTTKSSIPRTPRVYPSYRNSSGINVDLEFIKLLGPSLHQHPNPTLLFLAKNPADSESSFLVKLVDPECYSEAVHRMLAAQRLAPLLHGTVCVAGAPSAIVMEYLDANSGWMTLQSYIKKRPDITINTKHPGLVRLLETMKTGRVVHGDLRPVNIMCRGEEGAELEIKVIDFDRAGDLGVARYPVGMNPDIPWPGKPRDFIGRDDDEKLLSETLAKL